MKESKSLTTILTNTLWSIKTIIKFNPWLVVVVALSQLFIATIPFISNRAFSSLLDSLVYRLYTGEWVQYLLVFTGLAVFSSVAFFLNSQFSRNLDTKLQSQLRTWYIDKISHLDYQHLENKDTANLISKVDEEFGWRMRQTVSNISSIFGSIISLLTVSAILLPKYPQLWLLIFISQIPQYFLERYWVQKDWQLFESNSDNNKMMWDLNYQLRQKNNISELRINNAVDYLYGKFKKAFEFLTVGRIKLRAQQTPSELVLILFSNAVRAACLYTLILSLKDSAITIGIFSFYVQTISQTSDIFRGLVFSSVSVTENSHHIGNFKKVMGLTNKMTSGIQKISGITPPCIDLINVSFKYPDTKRYIFKDLNLTINSGEEIALVGANGAGKSTLIKLLCRFYDPTSGKILINGIDLKDLDLADWYRHLSYLSQEFNVYQNLNLRENVLISNPTSESSDPSILAALDKADAQFIKKYDKGLDTSMSNRYGGEEPSWGQWQKIAIARIFYRNAPIMILDEPTASIDAVSEYKIFSNLYQKTTNKTVIIVSHRFSTVRNAQRILVIDKGKIVEEGSHSQLLKLNGVYAHSFNLQAQGYQDEIKNEIPTQS